MSVDSRCVVNFISGLCLCDDMNISILLEHIGFVMVNNADISVHAALPCLHAFWRNDAFSCTKNTFCQMPGRVPSAVHDNVHSTCMLSHGLWQSWPVVSLHGFLLI